MRNAVIFAFCLMGLVLGLVIMFSPIKEHPHRDASQLTDAQRLEIVDKCKDNWDSFGCR